MRTACQSAFCVCYSPLPTDFSVRPSAPSFSFSRVARCQPTSRPARRPSLFFLFRAWPAASRLLGPPVGPLFFFFARGPLPTDFSARPSALSFLFHVLIALFFLSKIFSRPQSFASELLPCVARRLYTRDLLTFASTLPWFDLVDPAQVANVKHKVGCGLSAQDWSYRKTRSKTTETTGKLRKHGARRKQHTCSSCAPCYITPLLLKAPAGRPASNIAARIGSESTTKTKISKKKIFCS